MIVRSIEKLTGTDRDVRGDGWRSLRILRRDDGMNYSLHLTELAAGSELELRYEHHLEANLCLEGEGTVVDLATGQQPLANEDGSIRLVANGEIYNADALRRALLAAGHRFASRTDTEVILHAYEDEDRKSTRLNSSH